METMAEKIEENLSDVRHRMSLAAERAGRDPSEVKLVAVTKGRSPVEVRAAHELGLHAFGENRVQEALSKMGDLADLKSVDWHMIGHIQSRKARDVAGVFSLVHSVDRFRIATKLDACAGEKATRQTVLIECNVSGEASKGGWPMERRETWEARLADFRKVAELPNLEVRGLMTMAPWTDDRAVLEQVFGRLRRLSRYLSERLPIAHWSELSMGMTDDFEVAIEQGATMIRVGRAIFGEMEPHV